MIKRGKGGKRRIVLMDDWGWQELDAWLEIRKQFPPGPVVCVLSGPTAGGPMKTCDIRRQLTWARDRAGLRRRANPHAFRHGFAVESRREGIDYLSLQRQLGHARLDITETYFRSIDPMEVLKPFARRQPPMVVIPSARSEHQ